MRHSLWNGSFGGSGRRLRAQAIVDSILGPKAPVVHYYGSEFKHVALWMDRQLLGLVAAWAEKNPGKVPGRAEAWVWHAELVRLRPDFQNAIVLGVLPTDVSWQFEAAFDGAALHESFHGLYSCQRIPTAEEIYDLIIKNWAKVPDWKLFCNFLLEAQNHVEDVVIERRGVEDYPGALGPMEALNEFCLGATASQAAKIRAKESQVEVNRVRRLLGVLFCLGHTISTPQMCAFVEEQRSQDPQLLLELEEGKLRPLLDLVRGIDLKDDLASTRVAIDLAAHIALEDLGTSLPAPVPQCPACGAGIDKLRGVLLPRQDRSDPRRTLVVTCTVCGHSEQVEVADNLAGAGGTAPEGPKLQVIDLEALQDLKPTSGEDSLTAQAARIQPGDLPDAEGAMGAAADQAWQQEARPWGAGGAEAPYRPYSPGSDRLVILNTSDKLQPEAAKLLAEVDQQVCALRSGLRRVVRSLQMTSVWRADDGIDFSEDPLPDTLYELDHGRLPDKAFQVESPRIDPSAAAVVVIDLSSSMSSWVRVAGMVMLSIALAMEDLRFPVACLGFRDGAAVRLPPPSKAQRGKCHRVEQSVDIVVFKLFQERTGSVLTRFVQVKAGNTTPMADGLQAGLEAVLSRPEPLKMVFVVTDGAPNGGTEPVIRRQILMGRRQDVYVCGIGVGHDAGAVTSLFDHAIHAPDFNQVPSILVKRVRDLVVGRIRQSQQ